MKKYQEKDLKGLNRSQLLEKLEESGVTYDASSKNAELKELLLTIEIEDPEVEIIEPEDALEEAPKSHIQKIIEQRQLKVNSGIVRLASVEDEIKKRQSKMGKGSSNMTVAEVIKERQNRL